MLHRAIAILATVCIALGAAGCALFKSNKDSGYEEVLLPVQTGSVLQRRVFVRRGPEAKPKKKKKEKEREKARKPQAEPSATPTPEEESTPPPDRFR